MSRLGRGPRVVVAPDKFKGSLTATEVADLLADSLGEAAPHASIARHPIADGGEGTVDLAIRSGFAPVSARVAGPLGGSVAATYALRDDVAVIEMAAACGLAVLRTPPDTESAATASTLGVGELVLDALDRGAHTIVIGVGGSATTDGGAGAAQALGARIRDASGKEIPPGGLALLGATSLHLDGLDTRLRDADLVIACDVDNPLTGPDGAAAVYGPQKGADPALIRDLDRALSHWADLVARATGHDSHTVPGAGAAGGLAFGLLTLGGGHLASGVETLMHLTGFSEVARTADLVIVGEGSLDAQSLRGKGPIGVAAQVRAAGTPVVAVVGRCLLDAQEIRSAGLARVYALTDIEPRADVCMSDARRLVEQTARRVATDWLPPSATTSRPFRPVDEMTPEEWREAILSTVVVKDQTKHLDVTVDTAQN